MEHGDLLEAAGEVHDELGPGYTEAIYHRALEHELSSRGISFSSEATLTIRYKGAPVGRRRPDLFVTADDGPILVELKADTQTGPEQLDQYVDLSVDDTNFDDVQGGVLLQFNDALEYYVRECDR